MDKDELVRQSDLMARGWTKALIRDFLPTPDEVRPNPHYQKAAPMKLYALSRVVEIEGTDEFKGLAMKAERSRARAKTAVATRRDLLLKQIASTSVPVPMLSEKALIERACQSYGEIHGEKGKYASPRSDPAFLNRICVNYLRHECSPYEEKLGEVAGKVGAPDARKLIREKVYEAISEAYPDLEGECWDQMERREAEYG